MQTPTDDPTDPPAVPEIRRIALRPTDVIIIESEDRISNDGKATLLEAIERIFPNQRIAVLDRGLTFKVAGPPVFELTSDECEELRTQASRPMVATGSPAVGWAIQFVRHLADRLTTQEERTYGKAHESTDGPRSDTSGGSPGPA